MSSEENVQIVKSFLATLGGRDKQGLLALTAEDLEWIVPGEDWPLAGTYRGIQGWRTWLGRLTKGWKLLSQSLPSSLRKETGFWSSARSIRHLDQASQLLRPDRRG